MSDETTPAPAPQEEEQLPTYVIEGARSSRSKCKTCKRKIDKDALRIGILIEGPYGVGYLWHHIKCAARRQYDRVEEAYQEEAWQHAKTLPKKLPTLEALSKEKEKSEERKKNRKTIPYIELDPSGRAKCKHCGEGMEKGSYRVVLGRGVYFGNQVRVAPIAVHAACVAKELDSQDCETEVEGFFDALRANSGEIESAAIEATITAIGELPDA